MSEVKSESAYLAVHTEQPGVESESKEQDLLSIMWRKYVHQELYPRLKSQLDVAKIAFEKMSAAYYETVRLVESGAASEEILAETHVISIEASELIKIAKDFLKNPVPEEVNEQEHRREEEKKAGRLMWVMSGMLAHSVKNNFTIPVLPAKLLARFSPESESFRESLESLGAGITQVKFEYSEEEIASMMDLESKGDDGASMLFEDQLRYEYRNAARVMGYKPEELEKNLTIEYGPHFSEADAKGFTVSRSPMWGAAFNDLIRNSLIWMDKEYTGEKDQFRIKLIIDRDPETNDRIIKFIDNGPGISLEDQRKIQSEETAHSTREGGSGVGINLSREAIVGLSAGKGNLTIDPASAQKPEERVSDIERGMAYQPDPTKPGAIFIARIPASVLLKPLEPQAFSSN